MTDQINANGPPANENHEKMLWSEARILVLGMTYPHYSNRYTENACTGGILEASGALVRIHPLPQRYLATENRPKTFQWIRARVRKHDSDPRPESLRIDPSSIICEDIIDPADVEERRKWLFRCPSLLRSVEDVKHEWKRSRASLAIVRPAEIISIELERRSARERAEWRMKERELLSQERLVGIAERVKPIDFPDMRFMVRWRCDTPGCETHRMGSEQWDLHELWRKLAHDPARDRKVLDALTRRLDLRAKDVYFYLGNFRGVMWNFGLMGICSLPRAAANSNQLSFAL